MKCDLWIIAAGKGTRMRDITIPKALIEIDGKSNLENTLHLVSHKFRRVFVVVAHEMEELVKETIDNWRIGFNITVIGIESGGGDGKAVLEAFEKVTSEFEITQSSEFKITSKAIILWGDAHLRSADIVDELLEKLKKSTDKSLIMPVVLEHRPYVCINTSLITNKPNKMNAAMSADFIKFGEVRDEGWHDQSIFGVRCSSVQDALMRMKQSAMKMDKDGNIKFTTQSGELTFLNIIHYLFNVKNPAYVYETNFPLMAYNTPEEVEKIKQSIKGKL